MIRSMKKLKLISKVTNVIFKLFLLYAMVLFILSLVHLGTDQIPMLAEARGAETSKVSGIDIGVFELDFRNEQSIATKYLIKDTILGFLGSVAGLGAIVFLVCTVGKLLKPMMQGLPYDGTVSKTLKKLGVGCISIGIVVNVLSYLQYRNAHSAFYEIVETCLSKEISGIASQFSIELGYPLIGVMILIFSLVFRYGEELQVQVDETL